MNPIVVVPARMRSTRLPEKPMALIAGEAMIVHVWRRACETELGPVVVACDHPSIAACVREAGGHAVMTREEHPSGTDRIAEALAQCDPGRLHDVVINFQGDLPTVAPFVARRIATLLHRPEVELATAVALSSTEAEARAEHIVKMVGSPLEDGIFRALYFTRARAPWGEGPIYHHIGLYGWRRAALEKFVALPPSILERREKLEQLRALEAGMRIDAVLVDDVPLGVDTAADLVRANLMLARPMPAHRETV